jgi:hypothetical protein
MENLNRFPVYAVLPASDFDRAKTWYREKLGLTPSEEMGPNAWYRCADGTWFILTISQYAGTARNTAAGFTVKDIESGFEDQRHRTVVDQLDLHVGPEHPGLHRNPQRGQRGGELLDLPVRHLRRRGLDPRWTPASAGVAVQRELRHDDRLALDVGDRPVHLAVLVLEDPEMLDLLCQLPGLVLAVVDADRDQDQEAASGRGNRPTIHPDLGPAHPLEDDPHA